MRTSPLILAAALVAAAGVLAAGPAHGQILNTLRGFADREPGWSGSATGYLAAAGGNSEYEEYGGALTVQWQGEHQRVRALGSGELRSSDDERTAENTTGHLRHNWFFHRRLATVAFVQIQRNPFQRLEERLLAGGGLRFEVLSREQMRWFLGVTTMFEDEAIEDVAGRERRHRMSSFVSLVYRAREGLSVDLTGFYQPRWSDFADARATAAAAVKVAVIGTLHLDVTASLQYDARPAPGVETTDWTVRNGLGVEF
ncbi:MAG: DUF481 domain-containing protein [Candidatus Krumholzibacteriia bacterium]